MRRSLAKFSESEASNHTPSLADFTTTTPELKFSVHTAVLNGIVAVPIMAVMMVVVTRLSVMGRFSARPTLTFFGWAGTALMAVTVVALLWSSFG
jgi:Mn2+/Fe2+ NRAMP family transporter